MLYGGGPAGWLYLLDTIYLSTIYVEKLFNWSVAFNHDVCTCFRLWPTATLGYLQGGLLSSCQQTAPASHLSVSCVLILPTISADNLAIFVIQWCRYPMIMIIRESWDPPAQLSRCLPSNLLGVWLAWSNVEQFKLWRKARNYTRTLQIKLACVKWRFMFTCV